MDTVKYTFLLAAFKTDYLKEAINSILNQSYKNFKLVVSDDCSPNNVKGVVDQFCDNRMEYVRNDHNIGGYHLVEHWNLQLHRDACSEYVIMASDDDLYDKDFLKTIDELTIKYPNVDLLRARCRIIDIKGDISYIDDPADEFQTELQFCENMYNCRHIRSFANFVFKLDSLKTKGGFINFPYAWYADAVSTLIMSHNGVAHTQVPLFSYRSSPLAISSTRNKIVIKGKMEAALMNYKWMNKFIQDLDYKDNKLNNNLITSFISLFRHDAFATIISYWGAFSIVEKIKIFKLLKEGAYFSLPSFGKELFIYYMGKII